MELDTSQQEAVRVCTNEKTRLAAVTGPAGTGKTLILRRIYDYFHNAKLRVVAAAPTGKAARRIKESTGIDAMTIHRLLRYPQPGEINEKTGKVLVPGRPHHGRDNPIEYDVVLADEYSMVNDETHNALLAALPRAGIIRMFGDANQLRPVEENMAMRTGPSNFEKILANKSFPSVKLTTIHRQREGSIIRDNAARILIGASPRHHPDEYPIVSTVNPVEAVQRICAQDAKKWMGLETQILSPVRKTWIGADKLSLALQSTTFYEFLDITKNIAVERHRWDKNALMLHVGDKVIIRANMYALNIFNGETGIVKDIDMVAEIILVDFGDRIVEIPREVKITMPEGFKIYNPQKDIHLGYVTTTHAGQGSEWPEIMYVMNKSCVYSCNRKNLYTGTTRARKKVNIVMDAASMSASLYKIGD
jgi:exodeoxyribonuclease V alpha subunit